MKKILVTTDFSTNSKAAIRFAIQLASQSKVELTFFHSFHIIRPTSYSEIVYKTFEESEILKVKTKLVNFIKSVYKSMDLVPKSIHYVIQNSFVIDSNIMTYAKDHNYDYICISRGGKGISSKFFGTNTSNLITHSEVPVIAIPNSYRTQKIKKILYASDLINLKVEILKVVDFAKPINAQVDLLHFKIPSELFVDPLIVKKAIEELSTYKINPNVEQLNIAKTLLSNLEKVITKNKPSLLIMFTDQNRSFFEKLFLSSNSAEYSLKAKVPVLVFKK